MDEIAYAYLTSDERNTYGLLRGLKSNRSAALEDCCDEDGAHTPGCQAVERHTQAAEALKRFENSMDEKYKGR